jgi:hypothetical protein
MAQARHLMLAALVAASVTACTTSSNNDSGGSADQSKNDHSIQVQRPDFGKDWPLTVDSGTLACEGSNGIGAVTFESSGITYGLNGVALQKGYPKVDPIWAANTELGLGLKKDIGVLIDRGLELCK